MIKYFIFLDNPFRRNVLSAKNESLTTVIYFIIIKVSLHQSGFLEIEIMPHVFYISDLIDQTNMSFERYRSLFHYNKL